MASLDDYNALVSAVERDDVTSVRAMLLAGIDVNSSCPDDDTGTALYVAAVNNSLQCVDVLLSHRNVNMDSLSTDHLQTPLMAAAAHGHVTIMKRLLMAGADVNRQTAGCSTALIIACHYGHVQCAHLLLEYGADPHITNPWGYTALYMATDTMELLERLLTYDTIDVNQRCGDREETALHLAAVIGSIPAINALISAGAHVNARTTHNENALWLAAWKQQTSAAVTLIQHNIELDVWSNGWQVYVKYYLPLEVALGLQDYVLVRALLLAGCSVINSKLAVGESGPLPKVPWVRLHTEAFDYLRRDAQQLNWLVTFLRNPVSLRELCRRKIRSILGTPLKPKLSKLEQFIPSVFIDFLGMKDI